MKKITINELNEILEEHKKWLYGNSGKQADLSNADLIGADLSNADLRGANLIGASLRYADLSGANLKDADLRGANLSYADLGSADLIGANLRGANLMGADLGSADLRGADLMGADLRGANLSYADLGSADLIGANLRGANLSYADLSGANLKGADLSGANLKGADLSGAYLSGADLKGVKFNECTSFLSLQCPEEGSFIGFKKCTDNSIVKLKILKDAKRSSATTRKCRASKAKVLEILDENGNEISQTFSRHDNNFIYKVGETVSVDDFDEDRWNECATGIHFFLTKQEAIRY